MTIGSGISSKRTGDLTIVTDLSIPRSTAHGWLGAAPTVVVTKEANLTEPERRQGDPEAAATRREARSAAPVGARRFTHIRLQALRRASAGRTRHLRILRAVDRAREDPIAVLRFLRVRRVGFTPAGTERLQRRLPVRRAARQLQ